MISEYKIVIRCPNTPANELSGCGFQRADSSFSFSSLDGDSRDWRGVWEGITQILKERVENDHGDHSVRCA